MRKRSAFTLVELLVVIGIIAVLVAILLPALNKARRQANLTACLSNQRQLTLALIMYTGDNKGYFPGGKVASGAFWAHWDPTPWNPYSLNNDPAHPSPKFLSKYTGTKVPSMSPLAFCPAVDQSNPVVIGNYYGVGSNPKAQTTYWYPLSLLLSPENVRLVWAKPPYPNQDPQKLSSVKHAAEKIVIIDYNLWHEAQPLAINLLSPTQDATAQKGTTRRIVPMGFADGHCEARNTFEMRRPDVNWTGHYPGNDPVSGAYGVKGKDTW